MREAVILFTRVPVPGLTKTRLQGLLSPEECAELHCCFLRDLKICCEQLGKDYFVFYTPENRYDRLVKILGNKISYFAQQGGSLGERMHHAISSVLHMGYEACVLIGSDIPELRPKDLQAALTALKDTDVVFGPTADGGYYLVGMKKPHRAAFANQNYGHGSVLQNTIDAISVAGLTFAFAPFHEDIDEPEDLLHYYERLIKGTESNTSSTAGYILEIMRNLRKV